MTERLLQVGDVDLCVETFGSPDDPTILLVHGACASMLWWPQEFCVALATRGRHVVRYDSRDTGRSVHYPAGRPPYSLRDLADDAVGVLEALTNHFVMRIDGPRTGGPADIAVPTLVVHGDVDPVHPLPHGRALADTIPDATLLVLADTGHDLPPQRFAQVVDALVAHTA